MKRPDDAPDERKRYWIRGPRTKRHVYFYPADDRAGLALMLFIGLLGLTAFLIGTAHILGSTGVRRRDVILAGIGLTAAVVGLYQANQLRNRNP